jgi:hypothetical protein
VSAQIAVRISGRRTLAQYSNTHGMRVKTSSHVILTWSSHAVNYEVLSTRLEREQSGLTRARGQLEREAKSSAQNGLLQTSKMRC